MEGELALRVDDGMAGVIAARGPNDDLRLARQHVDDLTLALITPLSADNGHDRHLTCLEEC